MYRNTNFQTHSQFPGLSPKSYANLNPQSLSYSAGLSNSNLNQTVAKLIRENQILSQSLQVEREKNYNLLELKRKMEDDIQRLEFQLDRIAKYEDLEKKQIQIKKYQLTQGQNKLQSQLDQYFEENKRIRAELRKCMSECEMLARQKQDLVNQNVSLLNQIAGLKQKLSQNQQQTYQSKQKLKQEPIDHKQMSPNIQSITTIRSIQNKSPNPTTNAPSSPQYMQDIYQSPVSTQMKQIYRKLQIQTNPSQQKISFYSPIQIPEQPKNMEEDFYGEIEPSPRSFSNLRIHEKLETVTSPRRDTPISKQKQLSIQTQMKGSKNIYSYASKQLPQMHPLQLNASNQNDGKLEVEQKRQLKDEVNKIRNQIVDELIGKYYKHALECAEKEKTNSLKLFIASITPNLSTLDHMVMNYLEARQMLIESCPTLRLKWESSNYSTPSIKSTLNPAETKSGIVLKNTISIGQMYERIKEGRLKQKSVAGQYLALFRLLTLVYKLEQEIDPQLSECIKHTALKQIHRIKQWGDGKQ